MPSHRSRGMQHEQLVRSFLRQTFLIFPPRIFLWRWEIGAQTGKVARISQCTQCREGKGKRVGGDRREIETGGWKACQNCTGQSSTSPWRADGLCDRFVRECCNGIARVTPAAFPIWVVRKQHNGKENSVGGVHFDPLFFWNIHPRSLLIRLLFA